MWLYGNGECIKEDIVLVTFQAVKTENTTACVYIKP